MKNNKLTLKALKAELDTIKNNNVPKSKPSKAQPLASGVETHKSSVAHDIKNSYIQNLHMRSGMFMLWLASGILGYAHKIPIIRKILGGLALIYGRTTIWKLLIKLRKVFIIFNAIIGVYMVFKTVGFSYDNILAGFAGIGHTYLEIFSNFTKRLFHWFVELFDHKLIPNVPGDNTGKPKISWLPKGIESNSGYPLPESLRNPENKLFESYKDLFKLSVEPTPTSWYRDSSNWYWLGGLLIKGVIIGGVIYFGYKFIVDPLFVEELNVTTVNKGGTSGGPSIVETGASPEAVGADVGLVPNNLELLQDITKSITSGVTKTLKKLNPSYWFLTSNVDPSAYQSFVDKQYTVNYDNRFYPFTKVNPFDSWFNRMRIHYLGETLYEEHNRDLIHKGILNSVIPKGAPDVTPVASGSTILLSNTPSIGNVGLGLSLDPGFAETSRKLASLPTTPTLKPLSDLSNITLNPFGEEEIQEAVDRLKGKDVNYNVLTGSPEIDEEIVTTPTQSYAEIVSNYKGKSVNYNKYNVLSADVE